jgi:hypothetical protein
VDGLRIRAGVHSGEVERQAGNVRGVAAHAVTRIAALAQPGEVLVSGAAASLLEGSDLELEDAGEHELKGLAGPPARLPPLGLKWILEHAPSEMLILRPDPDVGSPAFRRASTGV